MEDQKKAEETPVPQAQKPPALKKHRAKVRMRQEKFARALVQTGDTLFAAREAGWKTDTSEQRSATITRVMKNETVLSRIDELLTVRYPDHEGAFARRLQELFEAPLVAQGSKEVGATFSQMKDFLKMYAELRGLISAQKKLVGKFEFKVPNRD